MEITARLHETSKKHRDMIDAYAYWMAAEEAKLFNDYVLLHVRAKPWWVPKIAYDWLLKKVLVTSRFRI